MLQPRVPRRPAATAPARQPFRRGPAPGLVLAACLMLVPGLLAAQGITWIGGNVDWVDNAGAANWNPADEPDPDDDVIFNTPNTVDLGSGNSIQSLTLSNGISLRSNGCDLTIDGLLHFVGTSALTIGDPGSWVTAGSVALDAGGILLFDGGELRIDEESGDGQLTIAAGATLEGHGSVLLNDDLAALTTLLENNGTLSAGLPSNPWQPVPAGTLAITAADPTHARLDLDGFADNAVVNVFRNQTLDVNTTLYDHFNGDLNLFHNSTLDMAENWSIDDGTTIDVDNGRIDELPADVAYISGAQFTQDGGTITVIDNDGTLAFHAPFTQAGGELINHGNVIFNGTFDQDGGILTNHRQVTVNAPFYLQHGNFVNHGLVVFHADTEIIDNPTQGSGFTMPAFQSCLTLDPDVLVTVTQQDFDADGRDSPGNNILTIGSGATLDLDLGPTADQSLSGTTRLNGGTLEVTTDDDTWMIDGVAEIGAGSGTSRINGDDVEFAGADVTVGTGAVLEVNVGSGWLGGNLSIGSGARVDLGYAEFFGDGTFSGEGTLRTNSSTHFDDGTTTINTHAFDWDGQGPGHAHMVASSRDAGLAILVINAQVFDTDGVMNEPVQLGGVGHYTGSRLEVNVPLSWTMASILNCLDDPATIGGTSRMVLTGTLNAGGNTTISAPVTFGPGSTSTALGLLTVTGNAIYDGGTITGTGRFDPPGGWNNTVASDFTISTTEFNFGGGAWVVQAGGKLTVDVGDYDPDHATHAFGSTLTLESATADITTGDAAFVMDGSLNFNNSTGTAAVWDGDPLQLGNDSGANDANLVVAGAGESRIDSAVSFLSDADVVIGATLVLNGTATFAPVNGAAIGRFAGSGTLVASNTVHFDEATELAFSGGTVDLDGDKTDDSGATVHVDAPVTIRAATLSSFGKTNNPPLPNVLDIDRLAGTGALTVILDDWDAEWTLNAPGKMNLTNDNTPAVLLAGWPVNLAGTVDVTGAVTTTARLDLTGAVNLATPGGPFRLNGGTVADPNTIAGGTINGPGLLAADTGHALTGFGTITANVDFDGDSDLLASGGMLALNATLVDARTVGTAGPDGTFHVVPPWNSSAVTNVRLEGGELSGGALTIDNPAGISGHGLVSAQVTNNKQIESTVAGQTLKVQSATNNNDWDGTTNTGSLRTVAGTLEVVDNDNFGFAGTLVALNGTVFTNGFGLLFQSTSAISLANATLQQSAGISCTIAGTVAVGPGSTSRLLNLGGSGGVVFLGSSRTTVEGTLQLSGFPTSVQPGATFLGEGTLINMPNCGLTPANNTTINVKVENQGQLVPGGTGAATTTVARFKQSQTGALLLNINGTNPFNYDRLIVTDTAELAGSLALALGGGYTPAIGATFVVLHAANGLTGTFNPPAQPVGMPAGRGFVASYDAHDVTLTVIAGTPFDFWIASFPSLTDPADKTKTADPDGDGRNNFHEFATDGDPTSGANDGKIVGKIAPVGGIDTFTLTFPVRNGAVLDPADPAGGQLVLRQTTDGVRYTIQASDDLAGYPLDVTEVTGADANLIKAGLPTLHGGWTYRVFRSPGPVAGDPAEFMRVAVSE